MREFDYVNISYYLTKLKSMWTHWNSYDDNRRNTYFKLYNLLMCIIIVYFCIYLNYLKIVNLI